MRVSTQEYIQLVMTVFEGQPVGVSLAPARVVNMKSTQTKTVLFPVYGDDEAVGNLFNAIYYKMKEIAPEINVNLTVPRNVAWDAYRIDADGFPVKG